VANVTELAIIWVFIRLFLFVINFYLAPKFIHPSNKKIEIMLANVCLILLVLTSYILIYNLAMFIFAKSFDVTVEKFYVFHDPWFSLFKTKVEGTEFGLGWIPLGGYIKMAGMEIAEGSEPQPHDFAYLSLIKQAIIPFAGPVTSLLLALNCASSYLGIKGVFDIAFYLLLMILAFFIYFKISPKIIKNKAAELSTAQQVTSILLLLFLYLIALYLMVTVVNSRIPFVSHTYSFFSSDVKFRDLLPHLSFHQKVVFSTYLGAWFFFMNLLPIGGMNGFHILHAMYEALMGSKISNKIVERYTAISFFVLLPIYGWLFYKFFF
jgi:membrane-associated protease RseP (regulator of RpoE activity)